MRHAVSKSLLSALLTSAAFVTVLQAPVAAAPDQPTADLSTSTTSVPIQVPGTPDDRMGPAAVCVAWARGDLTHLSGGDVSGHGWWTKGTCADATKALVTIHLQQLWDDGVWRNAGTKGQDTVWPGGGSANRATARAACLTRVTTGWRSIVDVDLVGFADTPNRLFTPRQNLACRH